MIVLSGCSSHGSFTTEDIVSKILDNNKHLNLLYTEVQNQSFNDNKLISSFTMKFYQDNKANKCRIDVINGNFTSSIYQDNEKTTLYTPVTKEVRITKDKSLFESLYKNPKDTFIDIINSLGSTHDLSFIGKQKINELETYHIKATPKEKKNINGLVEYWVDMKTWMVVKSSTIIGNIRNEATYKYDLSPKFDDSIFTLDIPKDAKITDLTNFLATSADKSSKKSPTLADVKSALRKPFVYFLGNNPVQLQSINIIKKDDENSVTIVYSDKVYKDNNSNNNETQTAFNVHMVVNHTDVASMTDSSHRLINSNGHFVEMQKVTVRGMDGLFFDDTDGVIRKRIGYFAKNASSKGFKYLMWMENDIFYSVDVIDDSINLEALKKLINGMVIYK